ncbi:MAG: aminotransferase class I/II-fold pyridoxal phosphate-dependent enzyme [Chlorobi bacterium]|nr:aminotransferase class I/II-fold pyridoxal phosphate-dependent enzyme [Chlorobiota bacterium]
MTNTAISSAAASVSNYYFSDKLKEINELQKNGNKIINLGIGNPDLAPPEEVTKILSNLSLEKNVHAYQNYNGIFELRKAFADWYMKYFKVKLNPENEILPLQGSKAGIMHISMAFLNKNDKVLIPDPAYPAYKSATEIAGALPVIYDLKKSKNRLPDLDELNKKDLSKVKIMWINYPNMPTGKNASRVFFSELINFASENKILVCNDNPYSFILNENCLSLLSAENAFNNAVELNSLSKSHNIAGWRIGALFGNSKYINAVKKIQTNITSGMFLPLQKAAIKALYIDRQWYKNLNKIYTERRKTVWKILDKLNCKYDKHTSGMFVWAEIPDKFKTGYDFSDFLLYKHSIFVTPGGIFGSNGNKYIRISLCNDINTLNKILKKLQ